MKVKTFFKRDIVIPKIQRGISDERLNILEKRERQYFKENNTYNFCMSSIVVCKINKKFHIIDGQHRVNLMKKLFHEGENFDVLVTTFKVKTEEEIDNLYLRINESLPCALSTESAQIYILANDVIKEYLEKYKDFFKTSDKPNKPNMKRLDFEQKINEIAKETDPRKFIEARNREIKQMLKEGKLAPTDSQRKKCENAEFYLGLVNDWLEPEPPTKRDDKIPKYIRDEVWLKTFSDKVFGKCATCKKKISITDDYDCAHIISVKNGGKTVPNNLVPMCRRCNTSLGSKNLKL